MATSRLERIGTIFSRVTGLLQARAMELQDRPIWYDVYKTFPPRIAPKYDRPAPLEPVRDIFYPEDVIRAKFHQNMGRKLPSLNLTEDQAQTSTRKVIERCVKIQNEKGIDLDEAFNIAIETLKHEDSSISSALLREKSERQSSSESDSFVNSFKQVSNKSPKTIQPVDLKTIFKDDK